MVLCVQLCFMCINIWRCRGHGISHVWWSHLVSDNTEYAPKHICLSSGTVDHSEFDIFELPSIVICFWKFLRIMVCYCCYLLFQVINPFTKYALLMNPLARSIEELLPPRIANSYWCFIGLRSALVISSLCCAFLIPFFGKLHTFFYIQKFLCIRAQSVKVSEQNGIIVAIFLFIH